MYQKGGAVRVAIRTGSTFGQALVDEDGRLTGDHSGLSIVRRLMKMWPDPILLMPDRYPVGFGDFGETFTVMDEKYLDVNETLIINMDVIDSVQLYRRLKPHWRQHPTIVNLVWWNLSEWPDPVNRREIGLSVASFPTFCNSRRTQREMQVAMNQTVSPALISRATVTFQNLGIEQPRVPMQERQQPPVVMYPAMWLFARKNPDDFVQVVEAVAAAEEILVEMRLNPKALPHPAAEALTRVSWADVDELAPREEYWDLLGRTTAFLATSQDESYGLQYLEALHAGVVGVFPARDWATNILPVGYPFLYSTLAEAKAMLLHVVRNRAAAWRAIEDSMPVNTSFRKWMQQHHLAAMFDQELKEFVGEVWRKRTRVEEL